MARIPQETIDRINDNADIVDVVSKHVDLTKRGRNFFGLCPFHNEKTPSFSVAPDKGIYHCFGCGQGGNAVNFIMEYEKITFVEALQQLGKELSIEVEFSGDEKLKDFFSELYSLHDFATELYHKTLFLDQSKKAKEYLLSRGFDEESLKLFKVGYAPKDSSFLLNKIKSKNLSKDVIEKSGLFGNSNSRFYDRFRSRIMFPISNSSGKVIAFGGRTFGTDDPAKYMNSPETPLYRKSEVFYGLNITRDYIRRENNAILVEGYTDLIQLFQSNIKNVIAVSGTAFTDRHVTHIRRLTSKVFLCYDGDSAGINASLKAGYSLLKGGVEPRIIAIPDKHDPDEWIKKIGSEKFKTNSINKAIGLINFHLKTSNFFDVSPTKKSNIIKDILSMIIEIADPIIKQNIIKDLSQAAEVEENQIIYMFSQLRTKKIPNKSNEKQKFDFKLFSTVNGKAELGLIQVLAGNDFEAKSLIKNKLDITQIENPTIRKLIEVLMSSKQVNPAEIISHFEESDEREIISKLLIKEDQTTELIELAKDCLSTLSKISVRKKIDQLRSKIREMELTGENTSEMMKKIIKLQKELNV